MSECLLNILDPSTCINGKTVPCGILCSGTEESKTALATAQKSLAATSASPASQSKAS